MTNEGDSFVPIEFVMRGVTDAGEQLDPEHATFDQVLKYLEDCKKLLVGNEKKVTVSFPVIEKGSIKATFKILPVLAGVFSSQMALASRQDYAQVDPARLEVLQKWNTQSNKNEKLQYRISIVDGVSLVISKNSPLVIPKDDNWMDEEDIIEGKVRQAGGKEPNIHFIPEGKHEGRPIVISATEEQLFGVPLLYANVRLHVKFRTHRKTHKSTDYKLVDFVMDTPEFDENDPAWLKLLEEGSKVWGDVENSVKWVREFRDE